MGCRICLQGFRRCGDQHAIHIHPERVGAIRERHGEMVPICVGDRAGDGVAGAEGAEGQPVVGIEVELFAPALPEGAVALAEEMALATTQGVTFGPEFNREIGSADVVGARIGNRDRIVDTVEGEGLAIGGLPGHPEGAVNQRANVSGPRGICQRGASPFIHAVGRHEAGTAAPAPARGRGNDAGVIYTRISAVIHGADAIAVARARG